MDDTKAAKHCVDVKNRLKKAGYMDPRGRIVSWNEKAVQTLVDGGHTSLDPKTCKCVQCRERNE